MSKNKSRKMQQAVVLLDQILQIEDDENGALPGSSLRHIKDAKKVLLRDIRKRREGRSREDKKHQIEY